ncbi:MAG: redoxin domain-containing protein [Nitrospirota bacterium]
MPDFSEDRKGPSIGEPAPFFEIAAGSNTVNLDDYKGNWLMLFTHPEDLLPIFRTRTIKYILCKRRIKAIALGDAQSSNIASGRNFLKKYIMKHSLTIVDDSGMEIARSYSAANDGCIGNADSKCVFVIDPQGILRIKLSFSLSAQRNFYEILKLVDALQDADRQRNRQPKEKKWERRAGVIVTPETVTEQN